MKLKSLAAAIALLCSSAAFATTNLGTLSSTATSLTSSYSYLFSDYTFKITSNNSTLTGNFGGSFFSSYGGDVWLYNSTGTYAKMDSSPTSISFSGLSAGTYTLWFDSYNLFSGGNITGSVSVAAPVPEADNYAMLAIGLSGIGVAGLRRRRRS